MTLIFDVWKDTYRACFWPFYGAFTFAMGISHSAFYSNTLIPSCFIRSI